MASPRLLNCEIYANDMDSIVENFGNKLSKNEYNWDSFAKNIL